MPDTDGSVDVLLLDRGLVDGDPRPYLTIKKVGAARRAAPAAVVRADPAAARRQAPATLVRQE